MQASLSDDEARLRTLADLLADAVQEAVAPWLMAAAGRLAEVAGRTLRPDEMDRLERVAQTTANDVAPRVRRVLDADVDAGLGTPLAVLRDSTGSFTAALTGLGFEPVIRDGFERRNFPADVYDLGPATFADMDPSLHEPGLAWGAARAHVHLRRRRDIHET
jgi:hypothetical protein